MNTPKILQKGNCDINKYIDTELSWLVRNFLFYLRSECMVRVLAPVQSEFASNNCCLGVSQWPWKGGNRNPCCCFIKEDQHRWSSRANAIASVSYVSSSHNQCLSRRCEKYHKQESFSAPHFYIFGINEANQQSILNWYLAIYTLHWINCIKESFGRSDIYSFFSPSLLSLLYSSSSPTQFVSPQ